MIFVIVKFLWSFFFMKIVFKGYKKLVLVILSVIFIISYYIDLGIFILWVFFFIFFLIYNRYYNIKIC